MYLIATHTPDDAKILAGNLDKVDKFDHFDLLDLNTMVLELIDDPKSTSWEIGDPIVWDEDGGLLIIEASPEIIDWFLTKPEVLRQYGVDPERLTAFRNSLGDRRLVEVVTF